MQNEKKEREREKKIIWKEKGKKHLDEKFKY